MPGNVIMKLRYWMSSIEIGSLLPPLYLRKGSQEISENVKYANNLVSSLGKVSIKKTLKLMEFPSTFCPPPLPPPFDGKKTFFSHNFCYVFIMFIITKFCENFKDKIDICFFYGSMENSINFNVFFIETFP